MPMSQEYTDRYAVGLDHGYAHAVFVDAYGTEHDRPAPSYDGDSATQAEMGYADGWAEGVERFGNGQWPDGTPITDE